MVRNERQFEANEHEVAFCTVEAKIIKFLEKEQKRHAKMQNQQNWNNEDTIREITLQNQLPRYDNN